MRGSLEAIGARPRIATVGRRWPARLKRPAPERALERLEVIERLAREERRALRAGEYVPDVSWLRRWR